MAEIRSGPAYVKCTSCPDPIWPYSARAGGCQSLGRMVISFHLLPRTGSVLPFGSVTRQQSSLRCSALPRRICQSRCEYSPSAIGRWSTA
jgi:hypothetical protein